MMHIYALHSRTQSFCRYVQPRIPLWVALRGLLGRLQQPAMLTVLQAFPQLTDIVASAATAASTHQ